MRHYLRQSLTNIEKGNETANEFHRIVSSILSILLYPSLFAPKSEVKIHEGRKRIDIVFQNAATNGVFYHLAQHQMTFCPYILVECKNYSKEMANPEFDQLSGRFSPVRSKVGLLIFRDCDNEEQLIARCKDTYRDQRGLIIPLMDKDLIHCLDRYIAGHRKALEEHLDEVRYRIQMT